LRAGNDRLIVTPEGFPIAYEVLPGNTSDKTTLRACCVRSKPIRQGKPHWVMDRGIPTEEVLAEMRAADPPFPIWSARQGTADKLEKALLKRPWQAVREGVESSSCRRNKNFTCSRRATRVYHKERSMRKRKLKWLWARLKEMRHGHRPRGIAHEVWRRAQGARAAWRLIDIEVDPKACKFTYKLNREKLSYRAAA